MSVVPGSVSECAWPLEVFVIVVTGSVIVCVALGSVSECGPRKC